MVKYNISEKGKAWRIENQDEALAGKSIGDEIDGKELSADLEGYTLKITGGSDAAGFPLSQDVEGIGLKKVLLTAGWGMRDAGNTGLRLRKTVRGKTISNTTAQINLNVVKAGSKPLAEVFPDQNKPKEEPKKEEASANAEAASVEATA
ncbi:MAG: S6e family ribosomal protein [Nanoarchaeota archaeon]|nr:S6e family ribosomal protein [Nanoarchaeota archaeon]